MTAAYLLNTASSMMSLDYSELGEKYGLTILKGAEVETEYGHVLVFGVTPELQQAFDFGNIHLALADVIAACDAHGAVAVPCHPGRKRVGMADELGRTASVAATHTLSAISVAVLRNSNNPCRMNKNWLAR